MTQIHVAARRKDDPPADNFTPPSGQYVLVADGLRFLVIEAGMESGEPSVIIYGISQFGDGAIMETSLDKLLMAAAGLMGLAEVQFGWERPEGYASLIPNAEIGEGRFHPHPDDDARLGEPCDIKNCSEPKHLTAMWRIT